MAFPRDLQRSWSSRRSQQWTMAQHRRASTKTTRIIVQRGNKRPRKSKPLLTQAPLTSQTIRYRGAPALYLALQCFASFPCCGARLCSRWRSRPQSRSARCRAASPSPKRTTSGTSCVRGRTSPRGRNAVNAVRRTHIASLATTGCTSRWRNNAGPKRILRWFIRAGEQAPAI